MNKISLSLLGFLIMSFCFAQSKDKDGRYYLPSELSSYVDSDLMADLYNGERSLNSLNFNTKSPWVIYSDRSHNKTVNAPKSTFNTGEELDFMEALYVTGVSGSWLKVQRKTYRVDGKLREGVDAGWVHADQTVLTRSPLLNKFRSTRKAMALISLEKETVGIEELRKLKGEYVLYKDPYEKDKVGIASQFEILYILKEANSKYLLSATDELGYNTDALQTNVRGWMSEVRTTPWDSKVCLEPNSGKTIEMKYRGRTADVFESKERLEAWHNSSYSNPDGRVKTFPLADTIFPPGMMRMPILSSPESDKRQTVKVATVGNPNNNISEAQRIKLREKLEELNSKSKDVNIVFVIDGTLSMERYYKSVAGSLQKILDDNNNLDIGARLRFGAVIYRDYADAPKDVEVFPLTANKSDVERWLMDVRCFSNDNDIPEAQYHGIIKGLDQVGMKDDQSNVIVLIGDAGNHQPDPKGITIDDPISLMSKYQANFISFQVVDKGGRSYNKFNRDAKQYIVSLSKKYVENSDIALRIKEKKHYEKTFEIKFVSNEGKDYTDFFMFGLFTFAPEDRQMSTEILEDGISDALSNYLEGINREIQSTKKLLLGRTSNDLDPQVIEIKCRQCCSKSNAEFKECVSILSEMGDFSFIGYTGVNLYEDKSSGDVYKRVVFVSYKELLSLQKKFSKLTSPMLTNSQRKERIYEAIVGLMQVVKDDPIQIIEEKTLNEAWDLILGIPFDDSKIYNDLGNVKIKDLRSNQSQEFKDFLEDVSIKSRSFNATKFKNSSFELADQLFYWIPLSEFPGNG